jgi:hypothetical protein
MIRKKTATSLSALALARDQARRGRPVMPSPNWLREAMPPMLKSCGALGFQCGRKRTGGRWLKQPAIVLFTRRKLDPAPGDKIKPIPKWIDWTDGARHHRLLTDVVELKGKLVLQRAPIFGPGDGVSFNSEVASVGAAVSRPGSGIFLTTAGHLLGHGCGAVRVRVASGGASMSAVAAASVVRGAIDYALLELPRGARCDNLFRDQIRIGPVFNPTLLDIGTPVMVLDRFGQAVRTRCRGVNARIVSGGSVYAGMITTDAITESGQSGSALIDDANRLWGFLIGRVGDSMSVFVPAQTVFDHAGVFLTS